MEKQDKRRPRCLLLFEKLRASLYDQLFSQFDRTIN